MGNAAYNFRARPFTANPRSGSRVTDVPAFSLLKAVASMHLFIVHCIGAVQVLCSSASSPTATAGAALWIVYRLDKRGLEADALIAKALRNLSCQIKVETAPQPPLMGNVYALSGKFSMKRILEKQCCWH